MQRNGKVAWQPSEQEKKCVVVSSPSQGQPINFPLLKKIAQRAAALCSRLVFQLSPAVQNELQLLTRQLVVFTGIPVDPVKQKKINKADQAGGSEAPAPAK